MLLLPFILNFTMNVLCSSNIFAVITAIGRLVLKTCAIEDV